MSAQTDEALTEIPLGISKRKVYTSEKRQQIIDEHRLL